MPKADHTSDLKTCCSASLEYLISLLYLCRPPKMMSHSVMWFPVCSGEGMDMNPNGLTLWLYKYPVDSDLLWPLLRAQPICRLNGSRVRVRTQRVSLLHALVKVANGCIRFYDLVSVDAAGYTTLCHFWRRCRKTYTSLSSHTISTCTIIWGWLWSWIFIFF